MNLQSLFTEVKKNLSSPNVDAQSQGDTSQNAAPAANTNSGLGSVLPGGLMGGAAAGGIMALLMGSKSTRKMAKTVAKYGGTAVLGGLAYKAYDNWQHNKALGQTQPISEQEIHIGSQLHTPDSNDPALQAAETSLNMVLIKAMIAASKADGDFDATEQQRLFDAIAKLELTTAEKAEVFDLMARDISVDEIAAVVHQVEHKSEVYLSAYLAIEVDDNRERAFLNDLAIALELPRGFPAYLEQQADEGVAV